MAQQATDAQILANKTEVGLYYAEESQEDSPTDWDLSGIDETPESVEAAIADIDEYFAPAPVEGETFTLTADTDRFIDEDAGTDDNDFF